MLETYNKTQKGNSLLIVIVLSGLFSFILIHLTQQILNEKQQLRHWFHYEDHFYEAEKTQENIEHTMGITPPPQVLSLNSKNVYIDIIDQTNEDIFYRVISDTNDENRHSIVIETILRYHKKTHTLTRVNWREIVTDQAASA